MVGLGRHAADHEAVCVGASTASVPHLDASDSLLASFVFHGRRRGGGVCERTRLEADLHHAAGGRSWRTFHVLTNPACCSQVARVTPMHRRAPCAHPPGEAVQQGRDGFSERL